ncbi:unnamed protein product [Heligmosomoides polygyrus]|uniref:G_PROTEIN_RECEP_F1_2 domain-containing protein n=1 Tax=Heligmosomoides polygyrus TaxID=6339 RepID=A0A3P8A544_HELPZ|nr:unnamed protein product [Heligmosomoides polygyrus]
MTEYEAASEQVLTVMEDLLSANLILAVMGFVCALFNVPLIYVLLASPKLRHDAKVKLIMCLAWGDLANCLSYSLLGYYRYTLFIESLSAKMIPIETSLSCAKKPNVWFSVLVVLAFCIAGLVFSIQNHSKGKVKFDCGRKATYTRGYARAIYFWEMSGFAIGCVLNLIAYFRTKEVHRLLKRIRYCLVLSVLSTVLVSIPNMKSLFLDQLRFVEQRSRLSRTKRIVKRSIPSPPLEVVTIVEAPACTESFEALDGMIITAAKKWKEQRV